MMLTLKYMLTKQNQDTLIVIYLLLHTVRHQMHYSTIVLYFLCICYHLEPMQNICPVPLDSIMQILSIYG